MLGGLTKREHQIALLVSQGLSNKAIGNRIKITEGTVKVHIHNIFLKLQLEKRASLIVLVIRDEIAYENS